MTPSRGPHPSLSCRAIWDSNSEFVFSILFFMCEAVRSGIQCKSIFKMPTEEEANTNVSFNSDRHAATHKTNTFRSSILRWYIVQLPAFIKTDALFGKSWNLFWRNWGWIFASNLLHVIKRNLSPWEVEQFAQSQIFVNKKLFYSCNHFFNLSYLLTVAAWKMIWNSR